MPKIEYVYKRSLNKVHKTVISNANKLLNKYAQAGIGVTLRTLYYRFVAMDLFPDDHNWRQVSATGKWIRDPNGTKNATPNYKWLGKILGDARLAGLIDWNHLQDNIRWLQGIEHNTGVTDALGKAARRHRMDLWTGQKRRPEVWVEKDALSGVISGVCNRYDVPYFCCRGYASLSSMHEASQRLKRHYDNGQKPLIIHLGDHDPSGMDMSRDIYDRLRKVFRADFDLTRIALNMSQIEELNPPPSPAKITDSRYNGYMQKYGDDSWELDALEPDHIIKLIEDTIKPLVDPKVLKKTLAQQAGHAKQLTKLSGEWEELLQVRELNESLTVTMMEQGSRIHDLKRKLAAAEVKLKQRKKGK